MSRHSFLRTVLSVGACKITRALLRALHKGGTALPGKVAMMFDKSILEVVSKGVKVIVVTGTNGKTTTSHMISHAFSEGGLAYLANQTGANLLSGVTTEFCCAAALGGKSRCRYAVIECDEGAMEQVASLIHPEVIVVTNLFRDQLDRYGEVIHALSAIRKGVEKAPEAVLCLNADCSLTSSLALSVKNPVLYYGLNCAVDGLMESELSDARFCIRCGEAYQYHYHTYAHLGDFYCPKCGYERKKPQVSVEHIKAVDRDGTLFSMQMGKEKTDVKIHLPTVYNVYNACAAVCGYLAFAGQINKAGKTIVSPEQIVDALFSVSPSFGRMESFDLNGVMLQMILVKNPASCDQVISYLTHLDEAYELVVCLNDRTADGHDISWIWDANYELFADDANLIRVYVLGDRAEDLQLRLKYAGLAEEMISRLDDYHALLSVLQGKTIPVFAMPNYTAMLALRNIVRRSSGKNRFWEG